MSLTVPWNPYKISFQTLIKLIPTTSGPMNALKYFNDARFNFYKDDFAMHIFY